MEGEGLGDWVMCDDVRKTEGSPMKDLKVFSCNVNPKGSQSACKAASLLFVVHDRTT